MYVGDNRRSDHGQNPSLKKMLLPEMTEPVTVRADLITTAWQVNSAMPSFRSFCTILFSQRLTQQIISTVSSPICAYEDLTDMF